QPGQSVTLAADALPGRTFEGTVDRVSPVVDTGTGTFRVVATFPGEGDLHAGMFSRLSINYDQRADALVIPRAALLEDGGEPTVRYVGGGREAEGMLGWRVEREAQGDQPGLRWLGFGRGRRRAEGRRCRRRGRHGRAARGQRGPGQDP